MPSPSPRDKNEHALEAKRRLKREVIHRLAYGNKVHSEMAEVNHVLTQRDNSILCEAGKVVNPDDASGAALEDALGDVAVRKQKSGSPDEWELHKDAWREYDPAFHHISTKAHQIASENRPKPSPSQSYAPRPAPAHVAFQRIRRDLTADSSVLAMLYRVLHVHCHQEGGDSPSLSDPRLRGKQMYVEDIKSETVLARAVHLLTLGAYAWEEEECSSDVWRDSGGGDVGSVFHDKDSAPTASDWVNMALLREPSVVMNSEWYHDKENALVLLKKIVDGGGKSGFVGGVDQALQSGARWICDFAAMHSPAAATVLGKESSASSEAEGAASSKDEEMERKKKAAKERAMAMMKAQMAKFAADIGDDDDDDDDHDDHMSEDVQDGSRSPSNRDGNMSPNVSTPVRSRQGSEVEIMDLSPTGDFILTTPVETDTPRTPSRTPHSSGFSTPISTSEKAGGVRLFKERPQCIVCGAETMQFDGNKKPAASSEGEKAQQENALAFCGYSQASTVIKGCSDGVPSQGPNTDSTHLPSHVGVHITLCGHAIHKHCCDSYIKTVSRSNSYTYITPNASHAYTSHPCLALLQTLHQRDDRLEGGKRREFRCPLCQRLSNCLVPFVDVAVDWVDKAATPSMNDAFNAAFKSEESELMSVDSMNSNEKMKTSDAGSNSLHDFLSTSKWWASRNDKSLSWDGQCTFSLNDESSKPSPDLPTLSSSPRQSLKKMQSKLPGKKDLVGAWNSVLKTPRSIKNRARSLSPGKRARSLSAGHSPAISTLQSADSDLKQKQSNSDVLRRFFDQISDVAHRADIRRLGEDGLLNNFGEFRHYLSEKAAYNKVNRAAGKEMVDVSLLLYFSGFYKLIFLNNL